MKGKLIQSIEGPFKKIRASQFRTSVSIAVVLGALIASVAVAVAVFSNPPTHFQIIAFPQRDFVTASGFAPDDRVIVRVVHDPAVYGIVPPFPRTRRT